MELIVKIGADQQQLQQTVGRMQQQFKNMNMSVPTGWDNAGRNAASWNAAIARRSGPTLGGLGNKETLGRILGVSLQGGIFGTVLYGLKELFDFGTRNLSQNFWERVYGVNDEMIQKAKTVYSGLRKSVQSLLKDRERESAFVERNVLANGTPEGQSVLLEKRLKEAQAAAAQAEKDLEYARANQKEAVIPKQDNSGYALREQNLRVGLPAAGGFAGGPVGSLFGVALAKALSYARGTPADYESAMRARLATQTADAERKAIEARLKAAELENDYKKALERVTAAAVEREKEERARKAAASKAEGKGTTFEADALARVGLFSGSSLLMNPDFTSQREQVRLLASIDNTLRHGTGDFS